MRAIEKLEKRVDDLGRTLEHQGKLLRALAPDPSEWKYTGEVIEIGRDGYCACGHPIIYGYILERDRDHARTIVGSTCINYFSGINPETFRALCQAEGQLSKRLEEERRAAKEAAKKIEVEKARIEFQAVRQEAEDKYESYRNRGEKAPYDLWCAVASNRYQISGPPEYKRTSDYLCWYKKNAEYLKQLILEKSQAEIHP